MVRAKDELVVTYSDFQAYSIPPSGLGPSKLIDFLLLKYFSFFRSIDLSEALELPGVVDVITAKDIPGTNGAEDDKLLAVDEVWNMPSQVTLCR